MSLLHVPTLSTPTRRHRFAIKYKHITMHFDTSDTRHWINVTVLHHFRRGEDTERPTADVFLCCETASMSIGDCELFTRNPFLWIYPWIPGFVDSLLTPQIFPQVPVAMLKSVSEDVSVKISTICRSIDFWLIDFSHRLLLWWSRLSIFSR